QRRFEEALTISLKAHALYPASANACNLVAASLYCLCRDEEALPWFDKAIDLDPNNSTPYYNKARALRQLRRFDEAIATYLRLRSVGVDQFPIDRGMEHIALLTGNFEAGWAKREAQWRARARPGYYPLFNQPIWLGDEPIEGKTLLIYADEGLGDTIHFAR